jgi:hypothetical protein
MTTRSEPAGSAAPGALAELAQLAERELPAGRTAVLREHLLNELRPADTAGAKPTRIRALRPAALAVGAAATAAVLVVVVSGANSQPASAEANRLLQHVATAAAHGHAPVPIRDDQFVYTKYARSEAEWQKSGPPLAGPVYTLEAWLSVDGSKPAALASNSRHGQARYKVEGGDPRLISYRTLQTLPTDPHQMLAWLHKNAPAGPHRDAGTFAEIGGFASQGLMPPAVTAALFRAAALIPHVEFIPDAVDAVGRHGVAVAFTDYGDRNELIFNKKTYAYLGSRTVVTDYNPHPNAPRKGQSIGASAFLSSTIVNTANQRPGGGR